MIEREHNGKDKRGGGFKNRKNLKYYFSIFSDENVTFSPVLIGRVALDLLGTKMV